MEQADLVTVGGLEEPSGMILGGVDSRDLGIIPSLPGQPFRAINPFAQAGDVIRATRTAAKVGLAVVVGGLVLAMTGLAVRAWRKD